MQDFAKLKGKTAYSYMRFSSPEQAHGDSVRRQTTGTEKFCEEVGLILDDRITDAGVSGFRGKNKSEGALGGFLRAFKSGQIANDSVLIIESLDRLSREKARISYTELLQLVNVGLTVVTLLDRQLYSAESLDEFPNLLFTALAIAQRAHEESATKAVRVSAAWANKRAGLERGLPTAQRLPGWLEWDGERVAQVPDRVKIVREIFRLSAEGVGQRRIVGILNDRGIEPWGKGKSRAEGGWQHSYIKKLLRSRAVCGEFQPHHKVDGVRKKVGPVIKDFYPVIVSPSLWHTAQAGLADGTGGAKGRPATSDYFFSGLAFDPLGGHLHLMRKGDGCNYLATALAFRRSGRPVFSWRLEHLQRVLLPLLTSLDWSRVFQATKSSARLKALRVDMAELLEQAAQTNKEIDRIAEVILAENLGAVSERMRAKARELTKDQEEMQEPLRRAQAELTRAEREHSMGAEGAKQLTDALLRLEEEGVRHRIVREVRRWVRKLTLYPDGAVPGFPVQEIRRTAAEYWGVAVSHPRVCGALCLDFVSGKQLIAWVTYRPGRHSKAKPEVISVHGLNYSNAEWLKTAMELSEGAHRVSRGRRRGTAK